MKNLLSIPLGDHLTMLAKIAGIIEISGLMVACATTPAPTEQVAVSTAAIAHAVSAGGPDLAPAEMQMARDKLDRAKLAMIAENYDQANSLAQEAQVDAQLAEAKSGSIKARKAADQLSEGVRVLREELDRKSR